MQSQNSTSDLSASRAEFFAPPHSNEKTNEKDKEMKESCVMFMQLLLAEGSFAFHIPRGYLVMALVLSSFKMLVFYH